MPLENLSRRRWETTLAEAVPEGPEGQPAHPAGTTVTLTSAVQVKELGGISFTVPRLSTLMLEAAVNHARTGERLRARAVAQTRVVRWTQPGIERTFTNEPLVFDAFREAAAAIVCAFAALDNLANELLPWDFVYTDPDGGADRTREQLEANAGIELRLSRVAAAATQRPNLRADNPELWQRLVDLKKLRDDISHAKASQAAAPDHSIFARVFLAPLEQIVADVSAAADHYLA